MEENRETLLKRKRVYYENCPGCKQDQRNEIHRGIPYTEFSFIFVVVLCATLPISSLFPFLYFMIKDFHIAKVEEDIGYYAGYLGSAFMIGRALTSVFWGVVADRYGRKPVIILGVLSVVIFNTVFGISINFWMAISSRFVLGCFNGVIGPIKAYASEVCREEYQALGLSVVSTSWGIGLIIGPAIGGFFAQPAEKYPNIFSEKSLFGRFPYFLPCLCISLIAVVGCIVCYWLPETLHKHKDHIIEGYDSFDALEASQDGSSLKENIDESEGIRPKFKENLLKNWPLMSAIAVYCVFSLHDMAYTEIFSLWAVSNKKYGGLSFSSQEVGMVLSITGLGVFVFQLLLYPKVDRALGTITLTRFSSILSIPLLACYPFIAMLSGTMLTVVINCASVLKNLLSATIVTGLFILQNNAVSQHQRGAANGISMTAMSCFKALGPAGGGSIFAWAQTRLDASFLPGDQMVFFILNVVELIGFILTFKPFLTLPKSQLNLS
eukprot:TRINITY_DN1262_c0_g1_i7.p1 TRINITY_DN1262_c0_g1~~TRINITY_DN1262_c0_g1_i7.p1  ORF type:complete len:494 (+),score=46.92 TRINITY_DN1262_c0_g1_i7:228-1709(+)